MNLLEKSISKNSITDKSKHMYVLKKMVESGGNFNVLMGLGGFCERSFPPISYGNKGKIKDFE
jgi:hypothetical protein